MNRFMLFAMALAASILPTTADAADIATRSFVTTGSGSGSTLTFTSTEDSSLKMIVSAWQANQSTGKINAAALVDYAGGLGVTGLGDLGGAGNFHQIDNAGGYSDFLLLQFNRAVTLGSANLNLYQMQGMTGLDSDLSWFNAGSAILPAQWNATVNLANPAYTNVPGLWKTVEGSSAAGWRSLNVPSTTASQLWLIGASQIDLAHYDGFKLAGLQVATAVPEPASWAMMIAGVGVVGGALRRRRAGAATVLA